MLEAVRFQVPPSPPSNPFMNHTQFTCIASACVLLSAISGQAQTAFDGFEAKMALEYGHLWSGEDRRAFSSKTSSTHLDLVPLNRNIISLNYQTETSENWRYNAGLKGILWWPFSTEIGEPGSRTIRVEPHVSILKARKQWRAPADSSYIEFGFFPYKYNRDARNLGEYLYRSGTYPGDVVTTDGYQFMDHSYYESYGIHARISTFEGMWIHDVNFFTEGLIEPIGDITPAYETNLNISLVELGFGAAYNRGLSYRPSKSRPGDEDNLYIEVPANAEKGYGYYKGPFPGAPSAVKDDPAKPYTVLHRWDQRGLKLMARAAVDLGDLLPEALRSHGDLRLFGELAVLGVKDQPYYYERIADRIPVMFGLNLPTLRLLDLLSVQGEYYGSKFNNVEKADRISVPIWTIANYTTQDLDSYKPNKWRWSLYGKKNINRLLNAEFQVASDHMRLRNVLSTRSNYELIPNPKNWYYVLKMEVGI